jgi:hypothetical protein
VSRLILCLAFFIWIGLFATSSLKETKPIQSRFIDNSTQSLDPLPPFPLLREPLEKFLIVENTKQQNLKLAKRRPPPKLSQNPTPNMQVKIDDLTPPSGAELLGGPIDLDSLNEPLMPPAASVERARFNAGDNPFLALSPNWRSYFRKTLAAIPGDSNLAPASQWHQPVVGLCRSELVPLLLKPGATPLVLQKPKSPLATAALTEWIKVAPLVSDNRMQPLLLHLDPLPLRQDRKQAGANCP